mgnify:FL=1
MVVLIFIIEVIHDAKLIVFHTQQLKGDYKAGET